MIRRDLVSKLALWSALLSIVWCGCSLRHAGGVWRIQGEAIITRVVGVGTYVDAGGKIHKAKPRQRLKPGATVNSAANSKMDLWLGDNGEVLQLGENATLVLEEMELVNPGSDIVATTRLELKYGSLWGNVKKLSSASRFEVKFPGGIMSIRGTSWAILPDNSIICGDGAVTVTFTAGGVQSPPFTVPAGMMAVPPDKPGAPAQMKPAPPHLMYGPRNLPGSPRPL